MTTPFSVTHGLMKGVAAVAAGSVARSYLAKFTLEFAVQCKLCANLAKHKAVNKGKIFGKCFVF